MLLSLMNVKISFSLGAYQITMAGTSSGNTPFITVGINDDGLFEIGHQLEIKVNDQIFITETIENRRGFIFPYEGKETSSVWKVSIYDLDGNVIYRND
jgi:hypothetical protein